MHGEELVEHGGCLYSFGESQREVMDRLSPRLSDEVALSAAVGGLGLREASNTARPAQLGALVAAEAQRCAAWQP